MAITRKQKETLLEELKANFSGAKSVVFAQNNGLTVKELEELRNTLRAAEIKVKVAKKRIMRMAAKEAANLELEAGMMEGPVAATFSFGDEVSVFKILSKFAKDHENLKLVSGVFEGKAIDEAMLKALADIPSREELLAKFVGCAKAPLSGFHGVLHGVMRQFVGTVSAYKDKKESEA